MSSQTRVMVGRGWWLVTLSRRSWVTAAVKVPSSAVTWGSVVTVQQCAV